jgi:hypothetical protein
LFCLSADDGRGTWAEVVSQDRLFVNHVQAPHARVGSVAPTSDSADRFRWRSATVSDLAIRRGMRHKFVYQQADKARCALDDAFISNVTDDTERFEIQAPKRWLRQVIVALALICRSSYLGIIEFMGDVPGRRISIGIIRDVLHEAADQADVSNGAQDLSCIRTRGCRGMRRACRRRLHYFLPICCSSTPDCRILLTAMFKPYRCERSLVHCAQCPSSDRPRDDAGAIAVTFPNMVSIQLS